LKRVSSVSGPVTEQSKRNRDNRKMTFCFIVAPIVNDSNRSLIHCF